MTRQILFATELTLANRLSLLQSTIESMALASCPVSESQTKALQTSDSSTSV
jgi:hypothetical protein